MRLTLRTLLAYMDGILEPEEAEDLRKKIEESDIALKLMERIREVTRRLRLGAPPVGGQTDMLDPNTVAEYLDNTLHGDQVPDFERACLDSEIQLAEVASCHQILTMILGEPAEIAPETRQRMYQLLAQVASGEKVAETAESTSPEAAARGAASSSDRSEQTTSGESVSHASKPKPTVPEYLREPPRTRRFWIAAVVLFLAGFATVIILGSVGLLEPGKPLARFFGIRGPGEPTEKPETEAPVPTPSPQPEGASPVSPSREEKLKQPEGVLPKTPLEGEKAPTEKAPAPEDIGKQPPLAPEKEKPIGPSEKEDEKTEAKLPPSMEGKEPSEKPHEPSEKPDEKPKPSEETPQAGPQLLGRLLSDREVLLRLDPGQKDWWRIAPQGNISSGERLLALPTFRPVIGLSVGVTITLTGGTEVELLPAQGDGPPGMKILFGRVLLSTVGKPNALFRIQVEDQTGLLNLLDPDSTAAIDVSRLHIPGNDPARQPDPVRVEIYASNGRSVWTGPDGKPVLISSGQMLPIEMRWMLREGFQVPAWEVVAGEPVQREKPGWIGADTSRLLDRRASPEIELAVRQDRLARIGLMELLEHRLAEVRTLASRSLSYLGEYQQRVTVLNKPEEQAAWFDSLDLLQEAVVRSPESADAVRQALEKQYGVQNGPVIYRMLLGYSEEQLKAGEAARLVDFLDHDELVFRVVSFWNLQKIAGKGFYYQPEVPKMKRDLALKRWRDWLAQFTAGKISLGKEAPSSKESVSKPSEKSTPSAGTGNQETPKESLPKPVPEGPIAAPLPPTPEMPPPEMPPAEKSAEP